MFSMANPSTSNTAGVSPAPFTNSLSSFTFSFLAATNKMDIWGWPSSDCSFGFSTWKSMFTSLMSKGMYCSAATFTCPSNSAAGTGGKAIFSR